jgi:PKHD-type hydroxylase
MIGEWCYFKQFFSQEQCQSIISNALTLPSQQGHLGVNGVEKTNDSYRRSVIRFIPKDDPRFQFLYDAAWKMALSANDEFFQFHITKLDFIQFAEYDESYKGEYKDHHDVFWLNNDPKYHRKLSAVIQLSDPSDYQGGNLELIDVQNGAPTHEEIKDQGTAVFFPSFFLHRATPVTKGKRYSLALWFDGPKWR